MSHINIQNVTIQGTNMYDPNRKLWHVLCGRKSSPVRILEDVTFEAKDGDRIGLLGKNGSGKSSLLKVMTGIYPPHKGSVSVSGKITSVLEAGNAISQQVQAKYAVKMAFVYNNAITQYTDEICDEIFEFAGLWEYKEVPVIQYSSGMRTRLSITTSLFQKGNIAIFDELLATTDSAFITKAMGKMDKIWAGVDIGIYTSHRIEEVEKYCDNCCVIKDGSILEFGKTEKMIALYNKICSSPSNS